jgi:hypothetical protein
MALRPRWQGRQPLRSSGWWPRHSSRPRLMTDTRWATRMGTGGTTCPRTWTGLRPASSTRRAKLTEEQVREIRGLRGRVPNKVLAARYG